MIIAGVADAVCAWVMMQLYLGLHATTEWTGAINAIVRCFG